MMRVLIADDHAIVREGFKRILHEAGGVELVDEAASDAQLIAMVRRGHYDVLVLDVALPERGGLETLADLRREFPRLPVLMLSTHDDDPLGVRAIQEGAAGFVPKGSTSAELVEAIQRVASGRRFVSPALAEQLAGAVRKGPSAGPAHQRLSMRELQTLRLLGLGKTLTNIGVDLNISVKTVSVYRARILEKLALRTTAELVHYAIRHKLVDML
jgi:two-component system, NarL family, invasion response regulator UvrY